MRHYSRPITVTVTRAGPRRLSGTHYTGSPAPTYDTITGILRAHIASICLKASTSFLAVLFASTPEGLQAKIVTSRRGGYCFEHASLMHAALDAIGFAPVRHASRVLLFEPRHESVRQHMFLTVSIGGISYVIDPGFGRPLLTLIASAILTPAEVS
jgi:N-hydroxyarylamine O-acetyltransferase